MSENRILAIDDDRVFRDFLGAVLGKTDHRWVITSEVGQFKRAYHELDPTVVLLDMVMPGTDGFDLMQWLMEQGYTSKLVVVTGYNPRYAEMAKTLGSDRGLSDVISLPKPVGLASLRAALGLTRSPA